ncbi:MAG: nucleotidyl transferase AbiEii/AbiGii toxin family protein [bacterium]
MIPLTRQDILLHQTVAPWPSQRQVEQDLLLCRAMAALFNDSFLQTQLAMRGGTLLHKVYLAPAARFSEDIDLVVVGDRPEDHIRKALRRVLTDVLGNPKTSAWDAIALAIRNQARPSRILRMTYAVSSASTPGAILEIVVEANVTERASHRPIMQIPFEFTFRNEVVRTAINGYDIHEMLGTKMRALFQRRRGRDLFDLYHALTLAKPTVAPPEIIESFLYYLRQEATTVGRRDFVATLDAHLADAGFLSDMNPLLRKGITYDPLRAGAYVKANLLNGLPT